jgi:hypothetical protein
MVCLSSCRIGGAPRSAMVAAGHPPVCADGRTLSEPVMFR